MFRLSGAKSQPYAQWVTKVENERAALQLREKGAFVISAGHLGNWEFMAHYWAEQGYPLAQDPRISHEALKILTPTASNDNAPDAGDETAERRS